MQFQRRVGRVLYNLRITTVVSRMVWRGLVAGCREEMFARDKDTSFREKSGCREASTWPGWGRGGSCR